MTSSVIDIGGTSYPAKTLSAFMQERKHVYVDILKIDVEGFEWAAIGAIDLPATPAWPGPPTLTHAAARCPKVPHTGNAK